MQTFLVVYGAIGAMIFLYSCLLVLLDYINGRIMPDTETLLILIALVLVFSIIWPFTLIFCLVNFVLGKRGVQ
jgi:hypothetical protein